MKSSITAFFMLTAAIGLFSIALAQTDTTPQDPKDNICYVGGAWEGKCDWPTEAKTDLAWNCGWYYARVLDGRISTAQAPLDCKSLAKFTPVRRPGPVGPPIRVPTRTPTYTLTFIPSITPEPTFTPTNTAEPTASYTPTNTAEPTASYTPAETFVVSETPTWEGTFVPSYTPAVTSSYTPTPVSPTPYMTPTPEETVDPNITPTLTSTRPPIGALTPTAGGGGEN